VLAGVGAEPEAAAAKAVQAKTAQPVAKAKAWSDPQWSELVVTLGLSGAVRLLASNCAYLRREENTVFLDLDPRSESMLTKQRKDTIAESLSEHFGEKLLIDIAIGSEAVETPVQQESRMADEQLEEARRSLEADPNVQAMKTMFGAELKTDTIELISGDKG
jgi:DNA polymerase-3 subunit gamma/tau